MDVQRSFTLSPPPFVGTEHDLVLSPQPASYADPTGQSKADLGQNASSFSAKLDEVRPMLISAELPESVRLLVVMRVRHTTLAVSPWRAL